MNKFIGRLLLFSIINGYICSADSLKAFIPSYYQPTTKNLKKEGFLIAQQAYQLLYFGQYKESLNLAILAVRIDDTNEKIWTILAETQITNKLYDDALISLNNAQDINPRMGEIYFAKGNIFLKQSKIKKAKIAFESGIKILPKDFNAIFQLGNIYLMERNYKKAIEQFDEAIEVKGNFWQAINNKALAYFELDKVNLSIKYFKKAIAIQNNAEPLLALASCLETKDINEAILLAKIALTKNPNYVEYSFREEQLWGEKLQRSTEKLFQNAQLKEDILLAKTKINKTS